MKIIGDPNKDLNHGLVLRRTGQILLFAGPLSLARLVALLAVVFPSLQNEGVASSLLLFVMALGLCLSVFLAVMLIYRGKHYSARGKAAAYKADTRQPVLYLRPFLMDERLRGLSRRMFRRGVWPWPVSIEEQLADALEPIGPLVAIGRGTEPRYAIIKELSVQYSIKECCRALKVSRSGYYQWVGAEPSLRAKEEAKLLEQIVEVFEANKERYGRELRRQSVGCGENRVARLTHENELAARRKKAFRPRTTIAGERVAPNLIKDLEPSAPVHVEAKGARVPLRGSS